MDRARDSDIGDVFMVRARRCKRCGGLLTAAIDYYGRIAKAEANIPVNDIALVIKLHRHIANELERADPTAAAYAKAMEPIELPPIEYQATKKKEDTQK